MMNSKKVWSGAFLSICFSLLCLAPANAQNDIGGHIGVVVPMVQSTDGDVSTITDNLVGGFPMGVTIKMRHNVAFDFEVVPFLDENAVTNVLLHPGVLMGLTNNFTFGLRAAFETGGSFGVTPLLNKSFPFPNDPNTSFFVEAVVPVRFYQEAPDYQGAPVNVSKTLAMAVHVGVAF
ncbi:MAG: hypothetical protein KTR29_04615 [Rhodothermaceae bacterium]|nr:hypothetical protein [Rhodothermaceae bacterium]